MYSPSMATAVNNYYFLYEDHESQQGVFYISILS